MESFVHWKCSITNIDGGAINVNDVLCSWWSPFFWFKSNEESHGPYEESGESHTTQFITIMNELNGHANAS